jgi:FMN phosphatase YigB (HAD superfamily)
MSYITCDVAGLDRLLDDHGGNRSILSLDCFDTLVWREVMAPTDAFYRLSEYPTFRKLGLTARSRISGESAARSARQLRDAKHEVSLDEIYRHTAPGAAEDQIARLVADELALEMEICFGFAPMLSLVRRAKAAGKCVIIVSDTYFDEQQLRELISAALGIESLDGLIDRVFCSSRFGVSKYNGLFADVMRELNVDASDILHVGDNVAADVAGAFKSGIRGVHFSAFTESIEEVIRLHAAAASVLLPQIRDQRPLPSLCNALWAQHANQLDAAQRIGHTMLGPVILGYMRWVAEQATEVLRQGKRPHLVFLLRDGWFPHRVYERLLATDPRLAGIPHSEAEISRFSGYAASFSDLEQVNEYLSFIGASDRYDALAKQLLLPSKTAGALIREAKSKPNGWRTFVKRIREQQNLRQILASSAAYRRRMMNYLGKTVGVQRGETVIFVDLGYSGTVQSKVQQAMKADLGVEVQGAYLLLRDVHTALADKSGWLDRRGMDARSVQSLVNHIAMLEQLCTCDLQSVVDYSDDGKPVRRTGDLSDRQDALRDRIQEAALEFVDLALASTRPAGWARPETARDTGAALLGRFLFLPSREEVEVLNDFHHDVNLGTKDLLRLFDPEQATVGLRRRGLMYLNGSKRQTLPMELRPHGIHLPLTLLSQERFGLDLRARDFGGTAQLLAVMVSRGTHLSIEDVPLHRTHDGYLMAAIGVGECEADLGLMFGKRWSWVQLERVSLVPVDKVMDNADDTDGVSLMQALSMENVEQRGNSLIECPDDSGFVFVRVTSKKVTRAGFRQACVVVFRPLEERCHVAPETLVCETELQPVTA